MTTDGAEEILTTEQAAERLGLSARRMQDLLASGRLPAQKAGREYRIASRDVDHLARVAPSRGRPRLVTSDDELGLHSADVAGVVGEAQTEEEMEQVVQDYLAWLENRLDIVQRLQPGMTAREVAFMNIERATRKLADAQRETWARVLQHQVKRERGERLADHLRSTYGLNVKVRAKDPLHPMDYCVELYAPMDTDQTDPLTVIYEAVVLAQTCAACGKAYGLGQWAMVAWPGTDVPLLCEACATSWNTLVGRQAAEASPQQFARFKRLRRQST